MKIKIQSISDIITNSSSETFTMLHSDSIKNVKDIIDSILALAGHGFHCDDFFKITECYDEDSARDKHEWYWDNHLRNEDDKYIEPNEEELTDFVHDWNDRLAGDDDSLIDTWLDIKSIDPDSKQAANLLNSLNSLFWYESRYDY